MCSLAFLGTQVSSCGQHSKAYLVRINGKETRVGGSADHHQASHEAPQPQTAGIHSSGGAELNPKLGIN